MPLDNAQKAQACGNAFWEVSKQIGTFARSYPGYDIDVTLAWQDGQTVFSSNSLEKIEALYSAHERLEAATKRPDFDAFPAFYQTAIDHPVLGCVIQNDANARLRLHCRNNQYRIDIGFLTSCVYMPSLLYPPTMRQRLTNLAHVEQDIAQHLVLTEEETGFFFGEGRVDRATLAALSPFLMRPDHGVCGIWEPVADIEQTRGKTTLLHYDNTVLMRMEMPKNQEDFLRKITTIQSMQQVKPTLKCSIPAAGNKNGYPKHGI